MDKKVNCITESRMGLFYTDKNIGREERRRDGNGEIVNEWLSNEVD